MNDKIFTESYDMKSLGKMKAKVGHTEYLQTDIGEKKKVYKYKILLKL